LSQSKLAIVRGSVQQESDLMTNQEWEERLNDLRDAQVVTQRLMELNERNWERRFEQLTDTVDDIASAVVQLADAQRITQASLDSLIGNIDRFIQGRQGNGH
jgi:hypothetical protein